MATGTNTATVKKPAFRFDGKNPRAQAWAAAQAARYVTRVSNETREALRALVVRSIADGLTADDVAAHVRDMVGLTVRDAGAVAAYESRLFKEGVLNRQTIMREVYKYSQQAIRRRALTIARTEIMGALNSGALAAAAQAVEVGLLDPATAVKVWMVSKDEINPPCPVCYPLAYDEVPLYALFPTKNGPMAAPPAHPRCRCSFAVLPESRKGGAKKLRP
jgi:hypothetical protein